MSPRHLEHTGWCTNHQTWVDPVDGRDVTEVCRRSVTVGSATIDVEASPAWGEHDLPIQLPDWINCDAKSARDLAGALIAAARLVEAGQR